MSPSVELCTVAVVELSISEGVVGCVTSVVAVVVVV